MDKEELAKRIKRSKILVVDDEAFMRSAIGNTLKDLGYPYPEDAISGEDALRKLSLPESNYTTVILDSELPGKSGGETLKAIREGGQVKFPGIPVIMMTGLASQEELLEFAQHKICGYLAKPITPAALTQAMQRALSNAASAGVKNS